MSLSSSSRESRHKNEVQLCGRSSSPCGYCSGSRAHLVNQDTEQSSQIYGLLVCTLEGAVYEMLIERGWRRSGLHLYKPLNDISCCPAYTIRLPVASFKPTKSQRKILKKMQNALQRHHTKPPKNQNNKNKPTTNQRSIIQDSAILQHFNQLIGKALHTLIDELPPKLPPVKFKFHTQKGNLVTIATTICAAIQGVSRGKHNRGRLSQNIAQYLTNNPSLSKGTTFEGGIILQSIQSHQDSGQILIHLTVTNVTTTATPNTNNDTSQSMDIASVKPSLQDWGRGKIKPPYNLTITTLRATESALQPEVHKLYFDYQQKVHNDPSPTLEEEKEDWGDVPHTFREQAEAMLQAEYSESLKENQMKSMISSYTSFFRFLVETSFPDDSTNQGTFHQHYRINGVLIAVGVIDVLPKGLSSVYAFYDTNFSHNICPLGKFMILKEIEYCKSLQLPYYYLGYYIHSCEKMRYKADYAPSELLCPETNQWVPAENAKATIDSNSPDQNYCRLVEPSRSIVDESLIQQLRNQIPLNVGAASLVTLNLLRSHGQDIVQPLVDEFISQVGSQVAKQCIIKLV